MPRRVLHDHQLRRAVIRHVVVPPLADRDALVEIVATKQAPDRAAAIDIALERDAELFAPCCRRHRSRRGTLEVGGRAVVVLYRCVGASAVLPHAQKFAAIAHVHIRSRSATDPTPAARAYIAKFEPRRLARQCPVVARCDLGLRLHDRGGEVQQRRLDQRGRQRRPSARRAETRRRREVRPRFPSADRFPWCEHCTAPLRQKFRSFFLLKQRAARRRAAQIDGKRQTDGAGANART